MRLAMVGIVAVLLLVVLTVSNRQAPVHGAGNAGFAAVPGSRESAKMFSDLMMWQRIGQSEFME